jgi:hypothetical protein
MTEGLFGSQLHPGKASLNTAELLRDTAQIGEVTEVLWPSGLVLESEALVSQLMATEREVDWTGAAVEPTTGDTGSGILPSDSGENGATVREKHSVIEYSGFDASQLDPTKVLGAEKPSLIGQSEVDASELDPTKDEGGAIVASDPVHPSAAHPVTVGEAVVPTVHAAHTAEGDESRADMAQSEELGPSRELPADLNPGTEVILMSARMQATATKRGSGSSVQPTRSFNKNGTAGGSAVGDSVGSATESAFVGQPLASPTESSDGGALGPATAQVGSPTESAFVGGLLASPTATMDWGPRKRGGGVVQADVVDFVRARGRGRGSSVRAVVRLCRPQFVEVGTTIAGGGEARNCRQAHRSPVRRPQEDRSTREDFRTE